MAIAPIGPISNALPPLSHAAVPASLAGSGTGAASFSDLINQGLSVVDAKVAKADGLIKSFAMGEPIPVHQVTIALEEARIAVELAVQVRERLTETYRSFMNMQL